MSNAVFEDPPGGVRGCAPSAQSSPRTRNRNLLFTQGPPPRLPGLPPMPWAPRGGNQTVAKNKDSDMSASSASAGSRFRPSGPRPWEAQNEVPGTPAPGSRRKPLACCKRRSGPNPGGGRSPGVRVFGDAQAPRLHGEQHMMVHDQGGRQCGRAQAGGMAADGKTAAA